MLENSPLERREVRLTVHSCEVNIIVQVKRYGQIQRSTGPVTVDG